MEPTRQCPEDELALIEIGRMKKRASTGHRKFRLDGTDKPHRLCLSLVAEADESLVIDSAEIPRLPSKPELLRILLPWEPANSPSRFWPLARILVASGHVPITEAFLRMPMDITLGEAPWEGLLGQVDGRDGEGLAALRDIILKRLSTPEENQENRTWDVLKTFLRLSRCDDDARNWYGGVLLEWMRGRMEAVDAMVLDADARGLAFSNEPRESAFWQVFAWCLNRDRESGDPLVEESLGAWVAFLEEVLGNPGLANLGGSLDRLLRENGPADRDGWCRFVLESILHRSGYCGSVEDARACIRAARAFTPSPAQDGRCEPFL